MVTCQICSKVFQSESKLRRHQETAACRLIRETRNNRYLQDALTELRLEMVAVETERDMLRAERDQLRAEKELLHGLASEAIQKPTVSNVSNVSNINNISLSITHEHLVSQAQYLTKEHISKGAIGYAEYAVDFPLKNRAVCSDFSRKKIQYKGENGEVIQDPNMEALTKKIFEAIEARNDELCVTYMKELGDQLDRKGFSDVEKMDIVAPLYDRRRECKDAALGRKSTLTKDFVNSVCSKLASTPKD